MSGVKLQTNPAGSGNVTFAGPNTSVDRTIDIPGGSGQLALVNSLSLRNKFLNGEMNIAQNGTSFANANGYTLDQWMLSRNGAMVVTVSQQVDSPINEIIYSLRTSVTTADTAIAAGEYAMMEQRLEGFDVRDLIGRTFTLSFWVKSPKTGTHCLALQNGVSDRSYVTTYTVNVANTWEYKTITFPGLTTDGTWDWTSGLGLRVVWMLACGTTFHTATTESWITGNFIATSAQVNCMDTVGNNFCLTGCQLEVGDTATAFEHRHMALELMMCQRYFEKVAYGGMYIPGGTATTWYYPVYFKVPKRGALSVTLPSATGAAWTSAGAGATLSTWGIQASSADGVTLVAISGSALGGITYNTLTVASRL
jgi:hypothetical protein